MHTRKYLNNGKTGALVPAVVVGGILLVVVAVLVLAVAASRVTHRDSVTERLISKIVVGVNAYQCYFPKEYPEFGASPDDTRRLHEALASTLEMRDPAPKTGQQRVHKIDPLFEFKPSEVDGTGNIVDSWGQHISYCRGRQHTDTLNPPAGKDNRGAFDLWSVGPPEEKGEPEHWMCNWRQR